MKDAQQTSQRSETAPTLTPEQQQEAREVAELALAPISSGNPRPLMFTQIAIAEAAYAAGLARGRAEERERCAKVYAQLVMCADAIRAAGAEEAGS